MSTAMLVLVPIGAFAVVMGLVIAVAYCPRPYRPLRTIVVVDRRTYRHACRQVDRLVADGLWDRAWYGTVAITAWLGRERRYGRKSRRARLSADYATWMARRGEYHPSGWASAEPEGLAGGHDG